MRCDEARDSFSASRSRIGCDANRRASKTLNGPTTFGNVGPSGKPNASRLVLRRDSVRPAETLGSRPASAVQRSAFAAAVSCSASINPRLCSSDRRIAWMMLSSIGAAVAVPLGMPPANGLVRGNCGPGIWIADCADAAADGSSCRTSTTGMRRRCMAVTDGWALGRMCCGRSDSSVYYNYSRHHNCMPPDLVRLVQALRSIQMCRGQLPWRYLDLTMAQLKAVMLLCRTGRARSRELADGLGIAPSAATPLVDRLVEQKLARRVDDPKDR